MIKILCGLIVAFQITLSAIDWWDGSPSKLGILYSATIIAALAILMRADKENPQ
jgi:hypothetical protein